MSEIKPAQTTLLMSASNMEGPTLEMLCEQMRKDLHEKTRFAREKRAQTSDEAEHNAWTVCIRNNVEIMQLLSKVGIIQHGTMRTFDTVFPQEVPRVVSK